MVCTAAMISGASAPVWAADDTETAAEAAEVTEYTYDMLEKRHMKVPGFLLNLDSIFMFRQTGKFLKFLKKIRKNMD